MDYMEMLRRRQQEGEGSIPQMPEYFDSAKQVGNPPAGQTQITPMVTDDPQIARGGLPATQEMSPWMQQLQQLSPEDKQDVGRMTASALQRLYGSR